MIARRSANSDHGVSTAVESITSELRERALAADDGASIGSEEELRAEFGVSRPTMRQASRILQYEGVLDVKRGVHGGYFATRPSLALISRLAANYLRSLSLSVDAVDAVLDALNPLIIHSVIGSGKTARFAEFAQAPRAADQRSADEVREIETRFSKLVMELTGNSAILFIHAVFFQVGASIPRRADGPDRGRAEAVKIRVKLAKALVDNDAKAAIGLSRKYQRLHTHGLNDDLITHAQKRQKARRNG